MDDDRLRIFLVPYCHPDWAWTHTRHWHEERYTLACLEALDILQAQEEAGVPPDAPEAFRWYVDVFVTELLPFLDRYPERLPELRRRVAEGRIAICGGYANPRINHVEGETFVRSLVHGRRAFGELFPEADLSVHADLVDVAWGHPQLPQLLRLAGYRYLRGWRPHAALDAKGIPHHFLWEGLDGSVVLCSRGEYGGAIDPELIPADFEERWEEVRDRWQRHRWTDLEGKRQRAPVPILWVQQGADDNRPLRAIFTLRDAPMDFPAFVRAWNRREPSRMQMATPVEVFRALEAERARLPLVRGTIDPCDVCYNAAWNGGNGLWRRRREAARSLLTAETLATLARWHGAPYPERTFDELWRATLLFSCHATQWLFEDDFQELQELAAGTISRARDLARQGARALAGQVALPDRALGVVVNPLPFERTALVPLLVTFVRGEEGGVPERLGLRDGDSREVPYQVQNELRHGGTRWELEVLAKLTLPAGGWTSVQWSDETSSPTPSPQPSRSRPTDLRLENDDLQLDLRLGRLVRVVERASGRVHEAPLHTPFLHLRACEVDTTAPLHAGPVLGRHDVEWDDWQVVERGPVRQAVRLTGRAGIHPVACELRLPAGERRVEIALTVDWRGGNGMLALCVPLPPDGELWGGIPYGAERKELGREPYGGIERQRPGMFWAQRFVDWHDGERGLAYVSHDGDTYYLLDADEHVLQHILVNSVEMPRDTWEKDVNAGMRAEGRHTFASSLVWHDGTWREAHLWQTAESLATLPLVVRRRHGTGSLPASGSLLSVAPANVEMAACYREGDAVLLRLFETAGHEAAATIRLPAPVREAVPVTLANEPIQGAATAEVAGDGREVRVPMRPWQIVTLALRSG